MTNFEHWNTEFRNQNLFAFNHNKNGLIWLKVRAVCRGKQIKQFTEANKLTLKKSIITEQFQELYDLLEKHPKGEQMLDSFLKNRNNEWYKEFGVDEEKLKSGLRRIDNYVWGGDQENSLDQYLIRRYVKVISDYDVLQSKFDRIASNAWDFVRISWYNNWTSYLIESIFKKHEKVLSAVGEIKSVDFFIEDFPIDLKVTYFPAQFMGEKIMQKLGNSELTWLKKQAKLHGITPDRNLTDTEQLYYLTEELELHNQKNITDKLNNVKKEIVKEAQVNPIELTKWLYENQSPRLFGAENRLFIVLVDSTDFAQSWKMKRAFSLMEPKINSYLENFNEKTLQEIHFSFAGKEYRALSDIIFIIKE